MLSRGPGSDHILWTTLILFVAICAKVLEGRLPMVLCASLATLLFYRRLRRLSDRFREVSHGDIGYPSLMTIVDSFMLLEIATILWGIWILWAPLRGYNIVDRGIVALLVSELMFLLLSVVHQLFVTFFFSTCVSHGFFLFAVLPRFVAGARTLLVSFVWLEPLTNRSVFVQFIYLVFKLVYFSIWVRDFWRLLWSKDFPREFTTRYDRAGMPCPVCLQNVTLEVELPCSHMFCVPCFGKWGSIKSDCPLCRQPFSSWIHQADLSHLFLISLMIF